MHLETMMCSYVNKGQQIRVGIWRRKDDKRVWYEWAVLAPIKTKIHNVDGKGQWIGMCSCCFEHTLFR